MATNPAHDSLNVDTSLKRKCPSHKLRDLRRSCVFILAKQTMENKIIKEENYLYSNENTILKRDKSILEVENNNFKHENVNLERQYNNSKDENTRLKNEILDTKKSNATFDHDKKTSLAAQKDRYVERNPEETNVLT